MADEAALLEGVFDDDTTASAAAAGSSSASTPKSSSEKGETLGVDEGPEPVLAPSSSQNAISKPDAPNATADTPHGKEPGAASTRSSRRVYQKELER